MLALIEAGSTPALGGMPSSGGMADSADSSQELPADLRARIHALEQRGCRVEGPLIETIRAEGHHGESVDWEMVVVLPDASA